MDWIRKIKSWLFHSGRGSVTSTQNLASLFSPVDLHHLRERIRPKEKGKENGAANIPLASTQSLDSVESEIVSSANDALRTYVSEYQSQLIVYSERIKRSNEVLADFKMINQLKTTMGDMKALVQEKKSTIYNQESSIEALAGEISNFREDHALKHRVPTPSDTGKMFFKIAGAGLLEIALTAALIRDAGDLFTVASIATVFFILNILTVFFIFSRFMKYKNFNTRGRPNIPFRMLGYFSLVLYVAYATVINLLFSHLRAVSSELERMLMENPESYLVIFQSVGAIAFQQFKENLFLLPDIQSYALFALGLFLSLYILIQGYEYGDKYLGYAGLALRYQDELDDFYDATEATVADFSDARDQGLASAQKILDEINSSHKSIPQLFERAESLHNSFLHAFNSLSDSTNILLNEYREENIKNRTAPVPEHFKERYSLTLPKVEKLSPELVPYPSQMKEEISKYRDDIFLLFDAAIEEIRDLRRILNEKYPFKVESNLNRVTT